MIRALLSILVAAAVAVSPLAIAPGPTPVLTAPMAIAPMADAALGPAPVYVHVVDWRQSDRTDVVTPACARLHVQCVPSLYTTGVVTIVLTDYPVVLYFGPDRAFGPIVGVSSGTPCEGRVWAVSDELVVTHEIGHALGLDHAPDIANVMYPSREGGTQLTPAQLSTVRHGARVMRHCS